MPDRTEILNWLVEKFGFYSYLEIGMGDGGNFSSIRCAKKLCVDPIDNLSDIHPTHQMTSDEFFAANLDKFDLIFIDGLHHWETVDRDIRNSLNSLNPGGIIVCHNINPSTEEMQRVPRIQDEWTGDCWRAWLKLRSERDDLQIFVLDTDYGVGVIFPDGARKTPRLKLPNTPVSFEMFMKKKKAWLPLVKSSRLRRLKSRGRDYLPSIFRRLPSSLKTRISPLLVRGQGRGDLFFSRRVSYLG